MSDLKRELGSGVSAHWHEHSKLLLLETAHNYIYLDDAQFQNLITFRAIVQTELASRQRLEP